ncbi:aspartate-alanine antiporter [Streptomyces sp. ICC1]|uniref:aspartate:alanine exchanger family transporter n=1 Tax=Streptomyces sp. ICC1 TaxID=2099583 RepID=UPI000DC7E3DA|nr:aspartate-alanine antiporter [Streptomyces sp. ICC1]AWZ18571.1 aspartate-alanine antiporter [Streptomyces sp. ICC1]
MAWTDWLRTEIFRPYPELLIFLTIAVGFLLGRIRYKSIALGAVTGCLVAGLVIGSQAKVEIDGPIKSVFFLMFLFALGYDVGPQFFRALRKDGLPQVVLALIVCVTGLATAWAFAALAGYGPGLSAGLLGGGLTQSAVIGVGADAIAHLPGIDAGEARDQAHLIAVAYAVTYPLGTVLPALLLAGVLPRLLHRDLAAESAVLAADLEAAENDPDAGEGYYKHVLRAYAVDVAAFAGRTIGDFEAEQKAAGRRVYITRLRRAGEILEHTPGTRIELGDVLAVSAVRGDLVSYDARTHIGMETDDFELLAYRTESLHVVVTERNREGRGGRGGRGTVAAAGGPSGPGVRTIRTLRHEEFMPGVFVEEHWRAGADLRVRLDSTVERGDTLVLTGPRSRVQAAAERLGKPVPTSFATDMVWIALGLFLGGCLGIPALHAAGAPLSLSTSTGALLMGLVFGWIRSKYPTYGNLPSAAQWLMGTLGLCVFVTVVGLNAGPSFVPGLREAGWPLLFWGAAVTTVPLLAGFAYGHFVQRLPLPILLGALAGAQTTTAALGALTERARSQIPALGTTVPYALGNILLTMWGSVIVLLRQ